MTHNCGNQPPKGGESDHSHEVDSAGGYARDCCCQRLIDEVNDLMAHPCDQERRAAIMKAVQTCPECFEAFGIEQEVRRLLTRSCSEPAPDQLRSKIKYAISTYSVDADGESYTHEEVTQSSEGASVTRSYVRRQSRG